MNRRTHTRDSKTDSVLAPNTKVLVWSNLPPGHASSRSDGSPGTISITTSRDENTKERTAIIALRFDSPEHPTLKYEKKNWTACNPIENWDLKGIEKVQNELRHQNVVCLQIIFPDSCTADVPPSYSSTSKQRSTKTLVIVFDRGRGDQRKWDRFKSIAITNTTQPPPYEQLPSNPKRCLSSSLCSSNSPRKKIRHPTPSIESFSQIEPSRVSIKDLPGLKELVEAEVAAEVARQLAKNFPSGKIVPPIIREELKDVRSKLNDAQFRLKKFQSKLKEIESEFKDMECTSADINSAIMSVEEDCNDKMVEIRGEKEEAIVEIERTRDKYLGEIENKAQELNENREDAERDLSAVLCELEQWMDKTEGKVSGLKKLIERAERQSSHLQNLIETAQQITNDLEQAEPKRIREGYPNRNKYRSASVP